MNNVNKMLCSTDIPLEQFVEYIANSGCTEHYVPNTLNMANETMTENVYVTLPNGTPLNQQKL